MPITRRQPALRGPSQLSDSDGELLDLPLGGDEPSSEPTLRRGAGPGLDALEPPPPRRRSRGAWWLILLLAFPIGALIGYLLSSDPPVAELSTDLLDFGEVELGESPATQEVRVTNRGEQGLQISSSLVEGEAVDEFQLLSDECAGVSLASGTTCTVRLAFAPAAVGARRARVRFDSNAVAGPATVPLVGVGVKAELAIDPMVLDFGEQSLGKSGSTQSVRLKNRGTAALGLERLASTGPDANDFRRVVDECSGRQLAPGEGCAVRFRFLPVAEGKRRAALQIRSDASQDVTEVQLVGTAIDVQPILRIEPAAMDFGSLDVGGSSTPQILRLINDGKGPLRVRGLRLEEVSSVTAGGAFAIDDAGCTSRQIGPGASCDIEIRFRPVSESAAQSALVVDSNVTGESARVPITGRGTAAHLVIEPRRVSFGETAVKASGAARKLSVKNRGSGILQIRSVELSGADRRAFELTGCEGSTLAPGRSCQLEVRFRPRRVGPHRSQLVLRHNADGGRSELPINGLGVAARLSLDRDRVDFGEVRVGRIARQRLVLRNSGRGTLTIRRLKLTGGRDSGFVVDGDTCSGASIAPRAVCAVEIVFRPSTAGSRRTQLTIEHSAGEQPLSVPILASASGSP